MSEFHAFQHRTKRPHYCDENKFYCAKRKYDKRTDGIRKDARLTNYELAVFKNVVIKCRASGASFHKIARAFHISSRTVHTWVSKIFAIAKVLIHVNINAIAHSFLNHILAYRNGWITELNIENILNGESIH